MHSDVPPYIFIVLVVATAVGVVLQAVVLVGMFIALRKTQKKVEDLIDDVRVHLMPMLVTSRSLIEDLGPKATAVVNDLTPKLKTISSNLVETTSLIRLEAEKVKVALDDVVGRTRGQAARVDRLVTGTLNGVEHATTTIQNGVAIPIKKISGWVAAAQVGFGVLFQKRAKTPSPKPYAEDAEGFASVGSVPAPTSYAYSKAHVAPKTEHFA